MPPSLKKMIEKRDVLRDIEFGWAFSELNSGQVDGILFK